MFTRTSRAKRRIGAAVLAALIGSLLAFATPANAAGTTAAATDRLSGANRYATAADVAQDPAWDDAASAKKITIVNGENFPDGLAAAALGQRILLVRQDSIPAETEAAIKALELTNNGDGVGEITVVGGTGVVSSAVLEALDGLNGAQGVVRIAGADRYATALAVAVTEDNDADQGLVIATGTNFPDALAAGPLAAKLNMGLVLVSGDSLSAAVKAHAALVPVTKTIYIVGGTSAVSQGIEDELKGMGKVVKRLAGADREATAVAVAGARGTDGDNSPVLVNRNGFADALAAGPFAALTKVSGSIMPVNQDAIPDAVAAWHASKCLTLGVTAVNNGATAANAKVYAIGGTGVISDAVQTGSVNATKCAPVTFTASVVTSNVTQATTEMVQAGGPTAGLGVKLTAVPGSIADGAGGNLYTFVVADSAAVVAPSAAYTVANNKTVITLTVTIPATGMSQADMAAAWNSTQAAALFTATPTDASVTGYKAFIDTPVQNGQPKLPTIAATANGSVSQTLTVTFNQAVDDCAASGKTLPSGNFTVATGDTVDAFAPTVATGSATTYTLTYAAVVDPTKVLKPGVSTVAFAADKACSAATDLQPAATAVKITAG